MVLSIFGASCQKRGEGLTVWQLGLVALSGAFYFCNEHLVCNNYCDACGDGLEPLTF
jgi:hypothetical protein